MLLSRSVSNIPPGTKRAGQVKTAVIEAVRQRLREVGISGDAPSAEQTIDRRPLIEAHVDRVNVSKESLAIVFKPQGNAEEVHDGSGHTAASTETIVIPFRTKNRNPRRDILRLPNTEEPLGIRSDKRQLLLRGIAKARTWASELAEGRTETVEAIAAREDYSPRHIRQMLPLAFLAPDIVTAILANTIPVDLRTSHLTDGLPYSWKQQREKFDC